MTTNFALEVFVGGIHGNFVSGRAKKNLRCRYLCEEPRKFCTWNPLTFWNMFKDLSPESRDLQIPNCAPIHCTVWPRNEFFFKTKEYSTII